MLYTGHTYRECDTTVAMYCAGVATMAVRELCVIKASCFLVVSALHCLSHLCTVLVCFMVRFSCSNSVSCLSFVLVIMTCSFTSFPPTPHPTPILCMCVCVCANVCVFRLRYIYAHAAGIDIVMLFCWRRNLCGLLCTGWGWVCVNTCKCVSVSIDILCTCC